MKKLVVILLMLAVAPVMAVEIGGIIDVNYFMPSYADSDINGTANTEEECGNSYFGEVGASLWATQELGEGLTGKVKLAMAESKSDGIDSMSAIALEELFVKKTGAFDQEALSFTFGKMEIAGNLDYDTSITHCFTNGKALISTGLGEIDNTWGLSVGYAVENVGTFTLSTFEAIGGYDDSITGNENDEDSGLFQSIALQWDTGADKDAFGVAGLRLVVAYIMLPGYEDYDAGSVISLGGTYKLMEGALTLGLEIDMSSNSCVDNGLIASGSPDYINVGTAETVYLDAEGGMLIALNADYKINEEVCVGLSYEMLTYSDIPDGVGAGTDLEVGTDSRMALRASYAVADGTKLRFEYAMLSNSSSDITEADLDGDGIPASTDEDDPGYSLISLGVFSKF
jgi:hypothetical protein